MRSIHLFIDSITEQRMMAEEMKRPSRTRTWAWHPANAESVGIAVERF